MSNLYSDAELLADYRNKCEQLTRQLEVEKRRNSESHGFVKDGKMVSVDPRDSRVFNP